MRLRKYGVEATIDFSVYEIDGVDLRIDWTPAAADCEIMKDGGASTQCTNTATDEGSTYSIVLTATEMQAARLVLKVVDAATKVFLDTTIIIETYGNASAQHAVDFDDAVRAGLTALPNAVADAAGGIPVSDAGGLDLDTKLANTNEITVARMGALTDWINGGRLDLLLDAIPTTAMRGTDGANTVIPPSVAEFEARTVSAAAAANIEDTYDGTGYTNAVAPATQSQMDSVSNVGAATAEQTVSAPGGFTLVTGANEAGDEDNTQSSGPIHSFDDTAGTVEGKYLFNIGGAYTPVNLVFIGRVNGNNDSVDVYANTGTIAIPVWIKRGTIEGQINTVNSTHALKLFIGDIMTGVDAGKVQIRFYATGLTSSTISIDQIYVEKTSNFDSTGYAGGALYFDDSAGNTNTVPDIDGTLRKKVSSWAAIRSLIGSTGIDKVVVANGSTVTLDASADNYTILGEEWTLNLNGQSINNMYVLNASVYGASTGTNYRFFNCKIALASAISVQAGGMNDCALGSSGITLLAAGTYLMKQCSPVNDSVYIDFENAAEAKTLQMTPYNGDIEFRNFGYNGVVHTVVLTGQGHVTFNANCSNATADDILDIHGSFYITDSVSSGWGGTTNEEARYAADHVADHVWDEVLTAGTHNIATSAGRRLRDLATAVIITGTSPDTAGTANTSTRIELDGDASAVSGAYDPAIVSIIAGTGIGQSRQIFEYDGTNKYAYVNRDWKEIPDSTSQYVILAHSGDTHINEGVAQGGAAGNITLNTLASSVDDIYNKQLVFIVAGTGVDQARRINDYNGTTKVADVTPNWDIIPDSTSIYAVLPAAICSEATIDALTTELAKVPKSDGTSTWNTTALASINAECDTAISDAGLPTAAEVKTAMEANNSDLDYLITHLVNKTIITVADGNTEQFNDAGSTLGSIIGAYSDDGTYVTRKRMIKVK